MLNLANAAEENKEDKIEKLPGGRLLCTTMDKKFAHT
jgi:hypothetical protein